MARIVLETGTAADPAALIEALTTAKGIAAWWTDDVDYAGGAETSMRLGFPVAPLPFELTVERVTDDNVVWRSTGAFPPHWADTTMSWTVGGRPCRSRTTAGRPTTAPSPVRPTRGRSCWGPSPATPKRAPKDHCSPVPGSAAHGPSPR